MDDVTGYLQTRIMTLRSRLRFYTEQLGKVPESIHDVKKNILLIEDCNSRLSELQAMVHMLNKKKPL